MSEVQFPPRVWLRFGDTWCEGALDNIDPDNKHAYLSLEEHEALIREARAKAFEDLIGKLPFDIAYRYSSVVNMLRDMAEQARKE